ncbi:MAG: HAMP domain-containing histidine kinase [Bacteroidales bacterium]|nr:HAMP domain-containing histidine kinase [Bacteroidales bacterium]
MKGIYIRIGLIINIMQALHFYSACFAYALPQAVNDRPILIISSYNPDSYGTSTHISEFIEEYNRLGGGGSTVHIENMSCRSFSESLLWKGRMKGILSKYRGTGRPGCIILLGQEAWASYLSQDSIASDIPVFSAMSSRNAIILPDSNTSLKDWMPESVDFISGSSVVRMQGGFLYGYDVESNINLIQKLYPDTRNIAFVSDNTYGGVSIQALVRKEMGKFPDMNLILLDGRKHTIYTVVETLRSLPPNTVLLLGTWRIDENDGYFMRNATYSMMEAVPSMPVFSLTSLGFDYWALGGYMPAYRNFGRDVAQQVIDVLSGNSFGNRPTIVPNHLQMDNRKITESGISRSLLPSDVELINVTPTLYQHYKYRIWTGLMIIAVLSIALLFTLFFYARTKRLKDNLEVSEAELRVAKENAEEANRLKSAFLANMSHEIRTPLNSIVGFSNILTTRESSMEERQTYSKIIRKSSDSLLHLINDILDISRLDAEKVDFCFEKRDLVPLLYRVLTVVEYSPKNNNELIFHPRYASFELYTDDRHLQQVLVNLLSNAAKFTKDGKITLDFEIDEASNRALFSVADTGCGIPADKRDAVFERFEKLDSYVQGTGLGLSICKLITSKWGGDIWIDPDYSGGSRFVFSHPLNIKNKEIHE